MTGLWPHQNGCTRNNIALPEEVAAFPELVGDPEYRTAYMGKWHLGDELYAQHGFEEWRSIEDMYARYYGENRSLDDRSSYHHFLKKLGYPPDTGQGEFSRGFAARLPIDHCKPKFLELEACEYLDRHRGEPFMLYVNFLEPHMPFFGPLDNEHAPEAIDLPRNFDDPLEENEPEVYRQARANFVKNGYKEYDLSREDHWRRLIAKYWGLVTQVDRSVGAILARLEKLGLAENTIVAYTSDHGDMMGAHRMLTKSVMYEEAARVPWLMRAPAFGKGQRVVKRPVSHIDLVPTLLDMMGVEKETALPGQSLCPLIDGGRVEEDHVVVEWNSPGNLAKGRNPRGRLFDPDAKPGNEVRTVVAPDGWKLSVHTKDRNQLFNLSKDPGETTNVYGAPEHREVVKDLTARIVAWQERVGDDLALSG